MRLSLVDDLVCPHWSEDIGRMQVERQAGHKEVEPRQLRAAWVSAFPGGVDIILFLRPVVILVEDSIRVCKYREIGLSLS